MYRVAIQISGQLRNWSTCSLIWKSAKEELENAGFIVDFHVTVWKEEYSQNMLGLNMFEFCTDVHLVDYSIGTFNDGERIEAGKVQGEKRPIGSSLYSNGVYRAGMNRRKYQRVHKVEYDCVIITRPDIMKINPVDWVELVVFLKSQRSPLNCMYFSSYGATYGGDKTVFSYRWSGDTLIAGSQLSANLFCLHYLYLFLEKEQSFIQQAHTAPAVGTMLFNLVPVVSPHLNCKIVRLDDYKHYDVDQEGNFKNINKAYTDSWKIE